MMNMMNMSGTDASVGFDSGTSTNRPDASVSGGSKRLFITRSLYTGDLGGTSGADALCQAAADSVGLSGTFKAWLSGGGQSALSRIAGGGPWLSMNNTMIFPNAAALRTTPFSDDYAYNERGDAVQSSIYWTGTLAGGEATTSHCSGWNSASGAGSGTVGFASVEETWSDGAGQACNNDHGLLCFGQ